MERFEKVIKEKIPTLVIFEHAGKQDSVKVKYLADELSVKFGDSARIQRVDTTHGGNTIEQYHLRDYPTYVLYKEGEELMRESGKKSVAELEEMIQRALD